MLDENTMSAGAFYKAVHDFSLTVKPWESTAIYYNVKSDEIVNLPLISFRVYGNFNEFLAVMAAAGLSSTSEEITVSQLILPNANKLALIKRQTGFESQPELRENFKPVWAD